MNQYTAPLRPVPLAAALVAAKERIAELERENARLRADLAHLLRERIRPLPKRVGAPRPLP